jgi:hypothetical protein
MALYDSARRMRSYRRRLQVGPKRDAPEVGRRCVARRLSAINKLRSSRLASRWGTIYLGTMCRPNMCSQTAVFLNCPDQRDLRRARSDSTRRARARIRAAVIIALLRPLLSDCEASTGAGFSV